MSDVRETDEARIEAVARALWNEIREDEDRCDMELEDMGRRHRVWDYARAAIAANDAALSSAGLKVVPSGDGVSIAPECSACGGRFLSGCAWDECPQRSGAAK